MNNRLFDVNALILAATLAGCASSGYSPPEHPRDALFCPTDKVWVCDNRNATRIERADATPMFCICMYPEQIGQAPIP